MINHIYIFGTILFTVVGQMLLKWRISNLNFVLPSDSISSIILSLIKMIIDPFILLGFICAFVASLFWMGAMSKFEITYAYPFMSLSPALVFVLGVLFLNETFTIGKLLGLIIICIGIWVTVKL